MTKILKASDIETAAELLKKGELVAFPTETVYGLGADAFNETALKKIYAAKGRPSDNPLIIHIADRAGLLKVVREIPLEAEKLIEAFFPGPLTLILPKHPDVSGIVCAGLSTVAVRMPGLSLARDLIQAAETPLAAPSANLSGRPSSTSAKHVLDDLDGKIAAVLDGGTCLLGIESTVVSLVGVPTILRPGSITPEQIQEVLKQPVKVFEGKLTHEAPPSPGMKYRHYAPNAIVKLFTSENDFSTYQTPFNKSLRVSHISAKNLYEIYRNADAAGFEEILIYCDAAAQNDLGLMNRLMRTITS